ncbi:TPA: hypothetical protein EYO12_02395 [Candidatus Saccharibacteria bacterium]|nr:hypothetical protein [Candidatus Saccharibacteria bacterium]HIO87649.1 hypothetical protein [Candidatus Saccharibacteria bacterium]
MKESVDSLHPASAKRLTEEQEQRLFAASLNAPRINCDLVPRNFAGDCLRRAVFEESQTLFNNLVYKTQDGTKELKTGITLNRDALAFALKFGDDSPKKFFELGRENGLALDEICAGYDEVLAALDVMPKDPEEDVAQAVERIQKELGVTVLEPLIDVTDHTQPREMLLL